MIIYLIRNFVTGDWWSNADGWCSIVSATVFEAHEVPSLDLPVDGAWIAFKQL